MQAMQASAAVRTVKPRKMTSLWHPQKAIGLWSIDKNKPQMEQPTKQPSWEKVHKV